MAARIIRIFIVLLGVMVLGLTMPDLYRRLFEKRTDKKWIYFSEITRDFIITEEVGDSLTFKNHMIYYSPQGETYTERQYTELLPFMHTKKLVLLEALPDSINGVPFDRELQQDVKRGMLVPGFSFAYQINPLFESQSGMVRPTLPDDVFRVNRRGVQFIDANTNRLETEKSRLFTEALLATGFRTPAKEVYGIPSVLKSRDDGYFIVDRDGGLYHMIMVRGEPVCRKIETDIKISYIKCMVPGDIYAYIYDQDMQMYILRLDWTVKKLPFPPSNGRYIYSHNRFYKTFKNTDSDSMHMYVLNPDYDLVAQHSLPADSYSKSREALIGSYIFPFRLMMTPGYKHMIPLPNPVSRFIWLNLVLAAALVGLKAVKRRRPGNPFTVIDILCVVVFGVFGFISVLIFPNRK